MPTIQEYESSIINRLAATDPQMNTSLGTPIRKIITAVATEIANYAVDQNTTNSLYALESVSGIELDYVVGQFGFTRQEAHAAYGTVRLSRDNGDQMLAIPYGSQFYKPATATTRAIVFQTVTYQELKEGVTSAELAVTCVTAGSDGNVAADTVTAVANGGSYYAVTNPYPMVGGRDAETDEELRARFLQTVFRNVSGTQDQYLGLALANNNITRAKLITSQSRGTEVLQVEPVESQVYGYIAIPEEDYDIDEYLTRSNGRYCLWVSYPDTGEMLSYEQYTLTSPFDGTITFDKTLDYTQLLAKSSIVTNTPYPLVKTPVAGVTAVKVGDTTLVEGTNYTWSSTGITFLTTLTGDPQVDYTYYFVQIGALIQVEFDYKSSIHEDDRSVDLFVDGESLQQVTDIQYIDFSKLIGLDEGRWVRADGDAPEAGHPYIMLSYQPVHGSFGNVNVGVDTILKEGDDYNVIYDNTNAAGSTSSISGIEILSGVTGATGEPDHITVNGQDIYDLTPIAVPYYYNDLVESVQTLVDQQSVVTMDCIVHAAPTRYFDIYLSLMYSTYSRDSINSTVEEAVLNWANTLPMGAPVQFSDIETVVANIPGVDNVRVATSYDANGAIVYDDIGAYGIVEYQRDMTTIKEWFTSDFRLKPNELFSVKSVIIYAKSQNTWR